MKFLLTKIFSIERIERITQSLRFVMVIFLLNYFWSLQEKVSDSILNEDYINNQTIKREVFGSFNVQILMQKSTVFIMSLLIIKARKWISAQTVIEEEQDQKVQEQQGNIQRQTKESQPIEEKTLQTETISESSQIQANIPKEDDIKNSQNLSISTKIQIYLGILSFLAIQLFASLQQTLNIYYLIQFRYLSFIVIIASIYLAQWFWTSKKSLKFSQEHPTLWKRLFAASGVIILSMVVKLNLSGVTGFYMSNLGSSKQGLDWGLVMRMIGLLVVDIAFYGTLYWLKDSHEKRYELRFIGPAQQEQKLSPSIILYATTKYTILMLIIFTILTSQLSKFLTFFSNHPSILFTLIKSSLIYFLYQYTVFYCLKTYEIEIFFAIMGTVGLWEKLSVYLINYWNVNSLFVVGFWVAFFILMSFAVSIRIKGRRKNCDNRKKGKSSFQIIRILLNKMFIKGRYTFEQKSFTI